MRHLDAGLMTVVDTNVWISAALSSADAPSQMLRMVLLRGIVVFSEATFAELETRLWKPKFDRYISLEARKAILRDGRATALRVEIPPELTKQHWSRDPGDDVFIRTALAAQAPRLVSGNKDLLSVPVVERLRIRTPAQALLDWPQI